MKVELYQVHQNQDNYYKLQENYCVPDDHPCSKPSQPQENYCMISLGLKLE
ncbi:hypothetical protein MA16_Dca006611 [Dendrobium catenatum]|uniref:Uncharacterized protein n=1 Tax=Dendrobium catenatum TaxID=906689 RepID=A0A2I0X5N2_9ASPA|nr:hypothetical protein MA16_Dca006611 [Dendrobium catenatum]